MAITIASYNLWNGSKRTYNRLIDYIKDQHLDVLCLQEVNGWQDDNYAKLNEFMDSTDYSNSEFGNSNSEYKLATLTKTPIVYKTVLQEGFWHCVVEVHVKVGDKEIVIFNVHLDPWKEEPRVKEIQKLLSKVDPNKFTIITGDFNSLSRKDNYPPEFLATLQREKFYKFGQDSLDFRVTDTLENSGFVDIAAQLGRMDVTTPTSYGESDNSDNLPVTGGVSVRIDYTFVSSNLLPFVTDFKVIKDEETNKISDHFPIVITLETEPQSTPTEAEAEAKTPDASQSEDASTPSTDQSPNPAPAVQSPPPKKNTDTEGELIIKHDDS